MKLDLGCGKNKVGPDWTGVDAIAFPGVDTVMNLVQRAHDVWCRSIPNTTAPMGGVMMMPGPPRPCDCTAYARDAVPRFTSWPWADDSVDEVHCSHFVEHLDADERIHFVNELWRVLKSTGSARIVTPYGFNDRAFGDLTHKWPPVHVFWHMYLNADWRASQAPHNDRYTCNFSIESGYILRPELQARHVEYQTAAVQEDINAATDATAVFRKLPMPAAKP